MDTGLCECWPLAVGGGLQNPRLCVCWEAQLVICRRTWARRKESPPAAACLREQSDSHIYCCCVVISVYNIGSDIFVGLLRSPGLGREKNLSVVVKDTHFIKETKNGVDWSLMSSRRSTAHKSSLKKCAEIIIKKNKLQKKIFLQSQWKLPFRLLSVTRKWKFIMNIDSRPKVCRGVAFGRKDLFLANCPH